MAPNQTRVRGYSDAASPSLPSPSASTILINPANQVLLLHRVQTSSAFPSAHVFPGGNLEPSDGPLPTSQADPARHTDNLTYRTGAIRELFEEAGILLARASPSAKNLLSVSARDRRRGRKAVHARQVEFKTWLQHQSPDAVLDTEGLVPFTHWVTPPNVPKRFTTQMYLYFVHVREMGNESVQATSDEVETMAAEWMSASEWLGRARRGEIIMFPPQFLLLSFVAEFLDREGETVGGLTAAESGLRRRGLYEFITGDGRPPWSEKFISPIGLPIKLADGRLVLGLNKPGPELKDSGLSGDDTRVVLTRFAKEGPREVEVRWKKEVVEEERQRKETKSKL